MPKVKQIKRIWMLEASFNKNEWEPLSTPSMTRRHAERRKKFAAVKGKYEIRISQFIRKEPQP